MAHWFDDFTRSLAADNVTRRSALRAFGAGVTALVASAALPRGVAADGNNDAAHFCQALPPGPDRGACVADAAHGAGLYYQCQGNTTRLCPAPSGAYTCCAAGQVCAGNTCVCNAQSCPNGCCAGAACTAPSASACGTGGRACTNCGLTADTCHNGQCLCGPAGPPCPAGQACVGGKCVCNAQSCPNGCCNGPTCYAPTESFCGLGGAACTNCGPTGDFCSGGACVCGTGPACADGETCLSGACCPNGQVCGITCCSDGRTCCNGECVNSTCGGGQVFDPASCACKCPSGQILCNGQCVDSSCPTGQTFNAATCQCECAGGQTPCNGHCVDTQSDPANCGGCGDACQAGQTCVNGACGCPTGTTLCNGQCVDSTCSGGRTFNALTCRCECGGAACPGGNSCVYNGFDHRCCPDAQACGTICCASGQQCNQNTCVVVCQSGQMRCGGDAGTGACCSVTSRAVGGQFCCGTACCSYGSICDVTCPTGDRSP